MHLTNKLLSVGKQKQSVPANVFVLNGRCWND